MRMWVNMCKTICIYTYVQLIVARAKQARRKSAVLATPSWSGKKGSVPQALVLTSSGKATRQCKSKCVCVLKTTTSLSKWLSLSGSSAQVVKEVRVSGQYLQDALGHKPPWSA